MKSFMLGLVGNPSKSSRQIPEETIYICKTHKLPREDNFRLKITDQIFICYKDNCSK